MFHNLISNALPQGENTKNIYFSIDERNGVPIIVCKDDGLGIPADVKLNIFTEGFGKDQDLGPFLSREILAITGITVEEQGEPGNGAKFVMNVPIVGIRESIWTGL